MTRQKTKSKGRSLRYLVFWGVPLLLAFSSLDQQLSNKKSPAQSPRLRFDGVYITDNNGYSFLRFYDDGTVVGAGGPSDKTAEETARNTVRWLNKSHDDKGVFKLKGAEIEFTLTSIAGAVDYTGIVEIDALKLNWYSHINGKKGTREYQFIPLQKEDLKEEVIAPAEPKSFTEVKVNVSGTSITIRVTMGKDLPGEKCGFIPLEGPPIYPQGTTAIAYQVIIDPPNPYTLGVGIRLETSCESTTGDRCNDYAIVDGNPVNHKWTTFLTCGNGQPFKPGAYKLQVLLQETPVREIPFEVK
jgi:hypothetical protein